MTQEAIAEKLAQLLTKILDEEVDPQNLDASIVDDYDADSMDLVDIADSIENEFSLVIGNDEIAQLKTFGDALRHVSDKLADAAGQTNG